MNYRNQTADIRAAISFITVSPAWIGSAGNALLAASTDWDFRVPMAEAPVKLTIGQ
jgi:hypothetical protein